MLHRCIEGERVGVDGSKIVDVDRRPDGTPAPPEERGREPPSSFFFLGLPHSWEEGSPSGPWPPWMWRGESPSEIGSVSLFSSASRSPDMVENRFSYSGRSVTPIALRF